MDANGRLFCEMEVKEPPPHERVPLRVAGLFAGIGGVERGLAAAGHKCRLLCEKDDQATAVLRHRFKNVPVQTDVRDLKRLPSVDLVAAGFPCQDLSPAGQTKGIDGSQSGLVWEVFRLIDAAPPEWILLENVPFMLQLQRGRALDLIVTALEDRGYSWAYRVVDTRAFGLPQRRQRVFVVASLTHDPRHVLFADESGQPPANETTESTEFGFYWTEGNRGLGWAVDSIPTLKGGSGLGIPSPPAIWAPDGTFATPDIRDAERLQGFPAGWTKPAEQAGRASRRWWLVGNAVSVPVARWIGRRLLRPGQFRIASRAQLRHPDRWPTSAWNVGNGRFAAGLSSFPKNYAWQPLGDFLLHPRKPLSHRAARGFLTRAMKSSLRFEEGFLDDLGRYVTRLEEEMETAARR